MTITVKQFLADLKELQIPEEAVIVMASDAEGNDFQPLEGMDPEVYWHAGEGILETPHIGSERAVILFPEHR